MTKLLRDKRQRDDNDLQDERQDQPKEKVKPRRSKRARNEKSFGTLFGSFYGRKMNPQLTEKRRDYGLHYDRYPAIIEGYSDANWISDIKDFRSTSGYVFTRGRAAISWKSSKKTVIAKSMMKSEFIAFDKCGEEAE
ncbi:hypothetical protein Tco_1217292 [Tanacetum coccineum]